MKTVSAAIIGASGYTGEELIRLLCNHPKVELAAVTSRQHAGKPVSDFYPHLPVSQSLLFSQPTDAALDACDVFFLALPHGEARNYAEPILKKGKMVLDLSADFRIKNRAVFSEFYHGEAPPQELLNMAAYGSPETNLEAVSKAKFVACAGCYPTSVLLALAPALANGLLDTKSIVINSMSGVSGAGRKADISLLFAECNENVRAYSIGNHRHVPEIEQELSRVAGESVMVQFTPHLLPVTRGILTTITASPKSGLPDSETLQGIYRDYYRNKPFVRLCEKALPEINKVVFSNRCDVAARIDARTNRLLFFSAEDNLTKGAGGQAVQCFNLMQGWNETEGLPR